MLTQIQISKEIKAYAKDGRLPIQELYSAYDWLVTKFGWQVAVVGRQSALLDDDSATELPILALTTTQTGPSFWILAGIHGEEPAGPNALAQNIAKIAELGQKMPVVLLPMCNPSGYVRNWRYPNEQRDWKKGKSVSDDEQFRAKILDLAQTYPPLISIDHHEDEQLQESYVYSQGKLGADDPVAHKIVELLQSSGIKIQMSGQTRFGEEIHGGVIGAVKDGSIDEMIAANGAKTVIVVETPAIRVPLEKRVRAHGRIIQAYEELLGYL
jgi:ACT domain-containing protein